MTGPFLFTDNKVWLKSQLRGELTIQSFSNPLRAKRYVILVSFTVNRSKTVIEVTGSYDHFRKWSGIHDLNVQPPVPKTGALPD